LESGFHDLFVVDHHRVAIGFLIARVDQRVQRREMYSVVFSFSINAPGRSSAASVAVHIFGGYHEFNGGVRMDRTQASSGVLNSRVLRNGCAKPFHGYAEDAAGAESLCGDGGRRHARSDSLCRFVLSAGVNPLWAASAGPPVPSANANCLTAGSTFM
jgi:hypothetical protein